MACDSPSTRKLPSRSSSLLAQAGKHSSSHSNDLPNIFTQMTEFSKKDPPLPSSSSPNTSCSSSTVASPKRQRSPGSSSVLSESLLSGLQSVLSLPSSVRNPTPNEKRIQISHASTSGHTHCSNDSEAVDNNKNCIPEPPHIHSTIISHLDSDIPVKKVKFAEQVNAALSENAKEMYICDRMKDMRLLTVAYDELLTELFFLQNGGNLMDYFSWKTRPNTLLACYLHAERLECDPDTIAALSAIPIPSTGEDDGESLDNATNDAGGESVVQLTSTPTSLPGWLSSGGSDLGKVGIATTSGTAKSWASPITASGSKLPSIATKPASHEANASQGMHESIAELARQERRVLEKISELRKKGLWSVRRLPKAPEPTHAKAHWDYVVEEMQWLANDFAQERKWKKAGARKIARMVTRYFQDQQLREIKAEREDALKLKRVASSLAKMVREFWTNIEKVVQYKQQSRLDEKRKKALDMHLSFIVDQTEKYSTWLTEGLTNAASVSAPAQTLSNAASSAELQSISDTKDVKPESPKSAVDPDDEDFKPECDDSADDEETIERDELEHGVAGRDEELAALQKESEMSLDDLIETLPQEMFSEDASEDAAKSSSDGDDNVSDDENIDEDGSYGPCSDESSTDDEETLAEQESHEHQSIDHAAEIAALQEEENMPIEELLKRYGGAFDQAAIEQIGATRNSTRLSERRSSRNSSAAETSVHSTEEKDEPGTDYLIKDSLTSAEDHLPSACDDIGTEYLLKAEDTDFSSLSSKIGTTRRRKSMTTQPAVVSVGDVAQNDESGLDRHITDIAADAMSLQPTGYTLETAHVKVAVPFLIKHPLREYQHVGLDWMATMYEHRLNGILADEMGLGKTIQTIALLAYLACEKSIWGPHLIVVPTSVMLNWEMEIKKWCPAFKILTYYGTLKERKMKRQGWTKTNAFHVCITSYKLVIQDHQAFRRKKWKYFILDEAQNIKNFKSQRWQMLLNFHSQRRLLLTGTPLQNNLMELWSLMHFLMPHVFQSHREFKEWFSNPLTGMIEGSREYNEGLVRRLHKVLRPFLLRRLKQDVEKQMPKKYEHVVMCRLSKRQRFLYDDFMSQASTKDTLSSGHFMSVINILMQLRKVCNHPDLFDPRPTISSFHMDGIVYLTASLVLRALEADPLNTLPILSLHPSITDIECQLSAYASERIRQLTTPQSLIVELDGVLPKLSHSTQSANLLTEVSTRYFSSVEKMDVCQEFIDCGDLDMSCSLDVETVGDDHTYPDGINIIDPLHSADDCRSSAVLNRGNVAPSLRCESLEMKRRWARAQKLQQLHAHNSRRCSWTPVFGTDCRSSVNFMTSASVCLKSEQWLSVGYVHCLDIHRSKYQSSEYEQYWRQTDGLREMVKNPESLLNQLKDIIDRFVFVVPPVTAPRLLMHVSHPPPTLLHRQREAEYVMQSELAPPMRCLHSLTMNTSVQFPERRLIQYDCGKLQTMDVLLRQLKTGSHRVLIFTQMTKMLDVLEAFLNFHGHRYLRLDGTTKVEQRQALMERFNADQRIFCFILSTRSGGIGVNLTGADTVIFYDSDWNPTMDAQAQDRCHRIGQTRDVHIYRLISEKTIEENILKKANEKRLLGNVAIEGGNFTTAFFRQQTIRDLFEEPSGLDSLIRADAKDDKPALKSEQAATSNENGPADAGLNDDMIEQALTAAEDETDVQAAKVARAEASAELAEFDENIPWDEREVNAKREREEESRVELELAQLENELTPIERYAVTFMELQHAPLTAEELQKAEEEVSLAKEEWEINHLKKMKEEEERQAEIEEDEMLYTNVHGSPRFKYRLQNNRPKKSKFVSSKVKPVISLYDYDPADLDSSTSSCEESIETSVIDEGSIIEEESDVSSMNISSIDSSAIDGLSFCGGRHNKSLSKFVGGFHDESFDGLTGNKFKQGKRKRDVDDDDDFEPAAKARRFRKPKGANADPRLALRKPRHSAVMPGIRQEIVVEEDDEDLPDDSTCVESSSVRNEAQHLPNWFKSYRIPRTPAVSQTRMVRVSQQDEFRPPRKPRFANVSSFARPASVGRFSGAVSSSTGIGIAGSSQPAAAAPTPILEKLSNVVIHSQSAAAVGGSGGGAQMTYSVMPIGTRISLRPRSASTGIVQQTVLPATNVTKIRYTLDANGQLQPQIMSPPQTASSVMNVNSGRLTATGSNVVFHSRVPIVQQQVHLRVPATLGAVAAQPQRAQNMFIVPPTYANAGISQKQSFVLASAPVAVTAATAAAPTPVAGEKPSYILLPTSNRQNFILAPAASVSSPAVSVTNTGLVLGSGLTLQSVRQQAIVAGIRPATANTPTLNQQQPTAVRQTAIVRAVAAPSSATGHLVGATTGAGVNPVPILEKIALQLNTGQILSAGSGPSVGGIELISNTSPVKTIQAIHQPPSGQVLQHVICSPGTSPVKLVQGSTTTVLQQLAAGSSQQQFIALPASGGSSSSIRSVYTTTATGRSTTTIRLINRVVQSTNSSATGPVIRPIQSLNLQQLGQLLRQSTATLQQQQRPVQPAVTAVAVASNTLQQQPGTSLNVASSVGSKLSTVIILDNNWPRNS